MGRIIPKIWWKIKYVWNHQPVVHGSCPIDEYIVRTIISSQPSRMFFVFFNPAFWLLKLSKKIGWITIFFLLNSLNYLDVSSVKTGRNHHWIGLVGHILIGDHRFPHEICFFSHEIWGFSHQFLWNPPSIFLSANPLIVCFFSTAGNKPYRKVVITQGADPTVVAIRGEAMDFSMFEMEISWIWVWINTY